MKHIHDIATLAHSISVHGKTNKITAEAVVREIIGTIAPPTDLQLAQLYNYFTPATPAKPKVPHNYVQRAVSSKDIRQYLTAMWSDGSRLSAADGHRLHIALNQDQTEGFYDKRNHLFTMEDAGKYPDIDRVIPSKNLIDITAINDLDNLPVVEPAVEDGEWSAVKLTIDPHQHILVRRTYFLDATRNVEDITIQASNPHEAILITGTVCGAQIQAVLMPIRQ